MINNILIIDDDLDFCDLLSRGLSRHGYTPHAVHTAEAVPDALKQGPYRYILLDLNLDKASGLQLLPLITPHKGPAEIIIVTGFASISTVVEAMKLGASNYIPKPITASELLLKLDHFRDTSPSKPIPSSALDLKAWEAIQDTLAACDYNITKTAQHLGISRRTLQRKLQNPPSL